MITLKEINGITLIELLVVLGVTIILTLAAIPSFISLIQTHRLSAVAESFYYNLQYARIKAIQQNTTVYVSFTTGDNWCYGIKAGSSCDCTSAGSCSIANVSTPSAQLTSLSATGYSSNYISFEGSHGSANSSGSVTFTTYQQSNFIKLSIGRMGNIQMCSTGISGYLAC